MQLYINNFKLFGDHSYRDTPSYISNLEVKSVYA